MRVYISADIEGTTGVVSWSQCDRPDGKTFDYPFARRMMTHDVNAAVRGARKAGATKVVVKDSHGNSKNLLIDELEPNVELISGSGNPGYDGMMQGVGDGFDAAVLIGYHAKAGTPYGIMEHTLTGGIHRLWINGVETGEIGLSAGTAGRYGVPIVAISSDAAGCAEAAEQIPGIKTAVVKNGMGRFSGQTLHPSVTGPLIEKAVAGGLGSVAVARLVTHKEPTTLTIEYNRSEMADNVGHYLGFERLDGYRIQGVLPTYQEAHRALWGLLDLEAGGRNAQF